MTKDSGFRVRIERSLRERFLEVCREQDKPAAQVIREFMREYIASHEAANDDINLTKLGWRKHKRKVGQ